MELKLVVVSGKTNKGAVTLTPPIVIGRSRQAQLTVAHPMISRRHCEIYESDGLLMIRDLRSLNGTVVDGRRVLEAPLSPGGEFSLGPLTFRAEYECAGNLDALPSARIAGDAPARPGVDSHPQGFSGDSSPQDLSPQDPSPQDSGPPKTEPLANDSGEFRNWDQTATEAVERPDRAEITLNTGDGMEAGGGCDRDTRPTLPRSSKESPSAGDVGPDSADAPGENLDGFLKGIR